MKTFHDKGVKPVVLTSLTLPDYDDLVMLVSEKSIHTCHHTHMHIHTQAYVHVHFNKFFYKKTTLLKMGMVIVNVLLLYAGPYAELNVGRFFSRKSGPF